MKMSLNRNLVHYSLCGRSVRFEKDKPTFVPPHMIKEIVALGGVVADDPAVVEETMKALDKEKADAENRVPTISEAVKQLVARNQRGDFTAGGRPNLNVLSKMCGFTVTAQEMEPIWNSVVASLE